MGSKKKAPKAKTYPTYSTTREPRNLAIARELEGLRRANPMGWRDRVLAAVRGNAGNVSKASAELGVGYRTVVRWLAQDEALSQAVDKIRETAKAERASAPAVTA